MQISKQAKLLIISGLFIIINFIFLLYISFFSKVEVVYVDNMLLFESFNMTKEMKKKGEAQFNFQKSEIDSLYSKIQKSTHSQQSILMKEYIALKENFEQTSQQFAYEESLKIWERLHIYLDEYSKDRKYKLIIGSENNQNVLFADPEINITRELINYVNSKYEGAK